MSRPYLSLDIRDHAISAFLVKRGLRGNVIENHAQVPVESAGDAENHAENPWFTAIAQIVEKLDAGGAACLVSLPPTLVSYRNLKVPFKENRKIRQVLPLEIEPLLPFPLDEVVLDFQIVRKSDTSDLIAAAVEKTKLQPILEALNAFQLNPQVIMPGGFPVALCLARQKNDEDFLYVDMDETSATLLAVVSERVHLVRSIYTGHVSQKQRLKTLKTNIQRFLVAFENFYGFELQPAAAYFSGAGTEHEEAAEAVGSQLKIQAKPVNMQTAGEFNFQNETDAALPDQANTPFCLIGIDLFRIPGLNFFQERYALYRYWEEYKSNIIKTGIFAALVLIIGMYGLIFQARHLSQQVNRMDRQIAGIFQSTFPDVSRIVDPLQQMQVKVREAKGKNVFAGSLHDEVLNIDILNDLSRLIPSSIDVITSRFVRGGGSVLISGHTDTFNAVDDIKSALSRSKYFSDITISSANMDKSADRVQFKLKLIIAEPSNTSG
ncbi:MAG: type II secretion system protein GspL [Desulfobacterales bacterium]